MSNAMLNKKKQITTISKSSFLKTPFFFNLPQIPKTSYFQTNFYDNVLSELSTVLKEKSKKYSKPFRFSFSQHSVRSHSSFTEHFLKQKTIKSNLKKHLLFLKSLLKKKKRYCCFFLKRIKGGYVASSLGLLSFTPKSLAGKVYRKTKKQRLLGFKFLRRKKRFSYKKFIKINLVSSSKKRKIYTNPVRKKFFI